MTIFALWYYFLNGEKSSNAISFHSNSLLSIHFNAIKNLDSLYHTYKKGIIYINVQPIECYIYNKNQQKLDLITKKEDLDILDGNFYALNYLPFNNEADYNQKEILVYLNKEDHENWYKFSHDESILYNPNSNYPAFFYDELISETVLLDTYYEEGIMNA